jgi:UDP-glucose 4-epimerase
MRILVTGGAGYIGSKICYDLLAKKHKVFIIDNLSTGHKKLMPKKAKFFHGSILNKKKITRIIKKNNINVVMHLAASLNVEESEKKPKKYFVNNVLGTKKLLEACKLCNIKYFIFSSTCAVYGYSNKKSKENDPVEPKSVYAKTKLKGELLIKDFAKKNNFYYAILRYFNVAGADLKNNVGCINQNNQLIKNLSLCFKNKDYKVRIYGNRYKTKDGTCVRDYIHLNDISKIHLLSLNNLKRTKKSFLINCGYGFGYSVMDIIKKFENILKIKIIKTYSKKRPGDIPLAINNPFAMCKKLKFNFNKNALEQIIRSSLKWEFNNKLK